MVGHSAREPLAITLGRECRQPSIVWLIAFDKLLNHVAQHLGDRVLGPTSNKDADGGIAGVNNTGDQSHRLGHGRRWCRHHDRRRTQQFVVLLTLKGEMLNMLGFRSGHVLSP
jgi:hypothetical protein